MISTENEPQIDDFRNTVHWHSMGTTLNLLYRKTAVNAIGILAVMAGLLPTPSVFAQNISWNNLSLAQGADMDIGDDGSASAESTVVKLPFSIPLKKSVDGRAGFKLRVPVYFSWNNARITDINGEDISRSLKTLVITPGVEVLIPTGERWLLRPFIEFGGISALDIGEHAWLGSTGIRASAPWDFKKWRLTAGGRLQYSLAWTKDWDAHDDVGSIEIGGSATFPLPFNMQGDRPMGGLFLFPRFYFDDLMIQSEEGATLEVDRHVEVGISFELPRQPKIIGIKLPAWYGVGYRFSSDYGAWRIYLGFPF